MLTLEIDLVEDLMGEVMKRIEKLDGASVDYGVLNNHQHETSTLGNATLFRYLSHGNPERNLPPRNVLYVTSQFYPLRKSPLKESLRKHLSNLKAISPSSEDTLTDVGKYYRDKAKSVFGDEGKLEPKNEKTTKPYSISPDTPMVEQGDLKKEVGYRINNGPEVK